MESALPELQKARSAISIYFALFALIEANLMDGDPLRRSRRMQQLQSLMADGRIATREPANRPDCERCWPCAGGDAPAAGAHIEQMQALAATLPRRARMEALRSELAAVQVAGLRGDSEKAVRALDNAATIERVTEGREPVEGPSAWRGYIFTLRAGLQRASGDESAMRTSAQAATEQFASTVPANHRWRAEAQTLLR